MVDATGNRTTDGTTGGTVRTALVSTDEDFRTLVREVLNGADRAMTIESEITVPVTEIGGERLKELRAVDPELVVLDLGDHPTSAIKFAQFLEEAKPSLTVIAAGPELSEKMLRAAMRAGIADYLPKPVAPEELGKALQRVERRLRADGNGGDRQPGELIAVFSAKGGSGSTTVATNMAIEIHRLTGKRTLLVDFDFELGEIALYLDVEPNFTFVDMVNNFHRMDADLLASYIQHHDSGIHLLSAPYQPKKAEPVTGEQIGKILRFLRRHYEYVIVDTSKSLAARTLAVFEQADKVFLVTNADLPSLRNLKRCLPLLHEIVDAGDESIRLVLNRYESGDMISVTEVESALGVEVYRTLRNDYEALSRSINTGRPAVLDGSSDYARDVQALSAAVAGLRHEEEESGPLTGFLRMLRGSSHARS